MGNIETHEGGGPPPDLTKRDLDLSVKVDDRSFHKHISGDHSEHAITELPWGLRDAVTLYESLNVSFNELTTIPPEIAFRIPHLRFLDLSYNRLTSLPTSLGFLFHLEELLLSSNQLTSIPDTVIHLKALQKLDLSHNLLKDIPDALGKIPALTKLNVSHNKLTSLPKSLGKAASLATLLAGGNAEITSPPLEICESGSDAVLKCLRESVAMQVPRTYVATAGQNKFPRVRGNQVATSVPNLHSAQAQYLQIQTDTVNTASRIKTPLLPPIGATKLDPSVLTDRITGLLYGAAIGDALGVATEFMSVDECAFYYDRESLEYACIRRDEHRVRWKQGDWTCNADQMFLVLDSLLRWAGVVDELDFAKRLLSWKRSGFPELGDLEGFLLSDLTKLVLQEDGYTSAPHQVALQVFQRSQPGTCNNALAKGGETGASALVDNGSLTRAIVLGIPVFHNLPEVSSNSLRICLATHPEEQCRAASVAISTTLATILQGRHDLYSKRDVKNLVEIVRSQSEKQLTSESNLKSFKDCFEAESFEELKLNDSLTSSHPFKALAASITALKQCTDYRSTLSQLAMQGGHSSVNCCLAGAFLGCRDGFSALPNSWVQGLLPKQRQWLNERANSLLDKMGLP
ncbi:unnamed protein product [Ixodes pacificus]